MKTEITEIKIKVGEKEFSLSEEEARSLHSHLDNLFKTLKTVVFEQRPWWAGGIYGRVSISYPCTGVVFTDTKNNQMLGAGNFVQTSGALLTTGK